LYRVALLLSAAFLILSSFRPMMDNVDLGWHVAQGRWMIEHGAVYRRDVMNYPNLGRPLVDEYPLFQIALFSLWKLGALSLFTAAIYGLLLALLIRAAGTFLPGGSALFAVALAIMILYFQFAFPLRPHLVTYLGVTILGLFLLRHRAAAGWTEFWPMALLQIVWTNCHSAFVLGPAMVGLFGLEMTVRRSWQEKKIAWPVARVWAGAFLFIFLACFVNPFGIARFYPPFYQGELQSIRAYVGEMQPLGGVAASLVTGMTLVVAAAVVLAVIRWRGAISYSFLFLTIFFYFQSLSVLKSWPVFGLFPPLLVLSCGAFGTSRRGWETVSLGGNLLVAVTMLGGLYLRISADSPVGLPAVWREYHLGRRELPYQAVNWMKAHGIEGRLLHRPEDGGLLQVEGYDHGETFGDTGLGKYDEDGIRLVSMVGERPALLPLYLAAYRPDYVVCNNLCYRWPFYLRQQGWRLIFYSPNSAVWTEPATRPDLPTVTDEESVFARDLSLHGRPLDLLLFGRNIIALNSDGREDFAFAQLASLPADLHRASWYWEAARILCFDAPQFSAAHRQQLLSEAEHLHDDAVTAEFRAFAHEEEGDREGARQILQSRPLAELGTQAVDLLLKIDLADHRPETLALAERSTGFDLRDGRHWAYLAQAEEQAGHITAAAAAWKKAVFYYPDDADLMARAGEFASKFHDDALARAIARGANLSAR
jgi:hypothetical protein